MAGWPRIVRAMIATGLTFAAGVGAASSIVGLILVGVGAGSFDDFRMVAKLSVVAFLVGVAFSGFLAITARSRRFAELSVPRFAALGAGAGLLYFLFIGISGAFSHWSHANAIGNLVILTLLGGGSATGTLMLARRGRAELKSGEESRFLDEG